MNIFAYVSSSQWCVQGLNRKAMNLKAKDMISCPRGSFSLQEKIGKVTWITHNVLKLVFFFAGEGWKSYSNNAQQRWSSWRCCAAVCSSSIGFTRQYGRQVFRSNLISAVFDRFNATHWFFISWETQVGEGVWNRGRRSQVTGFFLWIDGCLWRYFARAVLTVM
jgi:hypothetical protein